MSFSQLRQRKLLLYHASRLAIRYDAVKENALAATPYHEIRDPIHVFVRLDDHERAVLASTPIQRLRHIHQLAMSYMVYPGATHRRFEHSLGVMELAGRVFDVITSERNLHEPTADVVRQRPDDERMYWRKVLRMAALCHDIGHLPFSHAAERELLPKSWNHERLTAQIIQGEEMEKIWKSMRPPLDPKDIAKIAVGPKEMTDEQFSDWESLLYKIIGGDSLGVDRMDYLLRDSHHTGVAYGKFDHHRLIDTMRILPDVGQSDDPSREGAPALGIERGGIHAAEGLLLARYFMFMQVYHHRVRIAYDIHLGEFLEEWLEVGQFSTSENGTARLTDNDVLTAIQKAAETPSARGHVHAKRIHGRNHFRRLYEVTPSDIREYADPLTMVFNACKEEYGETSVRRKGRMASKGETEFPVINSHNDLESAGSLSEILTNIPPVNFGVVLIDPDLTVRAADWFKKNKHEILQSQSREEG